MKIFRYREISWLPAAHENPDDPGAVKKSFYIGKIYLLGEFK